MYEDDELTEQKKRVEKEIKGDTSDIAVSHEKLEWYMSFLQQPVSDSNHVHSIALKVSGELSTTAKNETNMYSVPAGATDLIWPWCEN